MKNKLKKQLFFIAKGKDHLWVKFLNNLRKTMSYNNPRREVDFCAYMYHRKLPELIKKSTRLKIATYLSKNVNDPINCLDNAFDYNKTIEGRDFWVRVRYKLIELRDFERLRLKHGKEHSTDYESCERIIRDIQQYSDEDPAV